MSITIRNVTKHFGDFLALDDVTIDVPEGPSAEHLRNGLEELETIDCLTSRVGAFATTDLESILRAQQVTSLVLLGIATSGVVLSTVRWAADADYELVVLEDGCADADEEVHRVLMHKVFPRQATVVQAQEFLQALAPVAEKP